MGEENETKKARETTEIAKVKDDKLVQEWNRKWWEKWLDYEFILEVKPVAVLTGWILNWNNPNQSGGTPGVLVWAVG